MDATRRKTAIEEGTWFIFYATNYPDVFRCDLVIKFAGNLRVILYSEGFKELGKQGIGFLKKRDKSWILRLTPWISLPISADQAQEFIRAHDRVSQLLKRQD